VILIQPSFGGNKVVCSTLFALYTLACATAALKCSASIRKGILEEVVGLLAQLNGSKGSRRRGRGESWKTNDTLSGYQQQRDSADLPARRLALLSGQHTSTSSHPPQVLFCGEASKGLALGEPHALWSCFVANVKHHPLCTTSPLAEKTPPRGAAAAARFKPNCSVASGQPRRFCSSNQAGRSGVR
jgi:hypothetical protein